MLFRKASDAELIQRYVSSQAEVTQQELQQLQHHASVQIEPCPIKAQVPVIERLVKVSIFQEVFDVAGLFCSLTLLDNQ